MVYRAYRILTPNYLRQLRPRLRNSGCCCDCIISTLIPTTSRTAASFFATLHHIPIGHSFAFVTRSFDSVPLFPTCLTRLSACREEPSTASRRGSHAPQLGSRPLLRCHCFCSFGRDITSAFGHWVLLKALHDRLLVDGSCSLGSLGTSRGMCVDPISLKSALLPFHSALPFISSSLSILRVVCPCIRIIILFQIACNAIERIPDIAIHHNKY